MLQDEEGKNTTDFDGRNLEVFNIYKRLNNANKHKMNPIPVCEIPKDLRQI
jgi:NAD+ synthase